MTRQWMWVASAWLGFAFFAATQLVAAYRSEGMHHNWPLVFAVTAISWLPWALATAPILTLGRRFPVRWSGDYQNLPVHILTGIVISAAFCAWSAFLQESLHPFDIMVPDNGFVRSFLDQFYNDLLSTFVLYTGILLIGRTVESQRRLASQEAELARMSEALMGARLDALRRQIEPHFLFNTLNAISGLVREGSSDAAVSMIVSLSDFLRGTLEGASRQEVPLSEEMAFITRYLAIQKARFADRLRLCVDIPPALDAATVPNLILQPLVENAVKHGIAKRSGSGTISIAASERNDTLTLSVSNDGPQLPADWSIARCGVGISNVRMRLRGLYGDDFAFSIDNRAAGGVEVVVSLPLRGTSAVE